MEKIGIHKLYSQNREKADKLLWGRISGPSRRGFLRNMGLISMQLMLGAKMVHAKHFPAGMIPAALADCNEAFSIPGKHPQMVVLNDRPINAETPPHLLDPNRTPADVFFVRNNGLPPARSEIRLAEWTLKIGGESAKQSKTYSLKN